MIDNETMDTKLKLIEILYEIENETIKRWFLGTLNEK